PRAQSVWAPLQKNDSTTVAEPRRPSAPPSGVEIAGRTTRDVAVRAADPRPAPSPCTNAPTIGKRKRVQARPPPGHLPRAPGPHYACSPMTDRAWQHPWLHIERFLRALIGERLIHGASDERDSALAAVIEQRQQIERAGWFIN